MALNSPENFGKPISEKLSSYLKKHTTGRDRAKVHDITTISSETQTSILLRRRSLTKKNVCAIIELTRIAIQNCMTSRREAKVAKEYLTKELPKAT